MDSATLEESIDVVLKKTSEMVYSLSMFHDGSGEHKECVSLATNLETGLRTLRYHVEKEDSKTPWYKAVQGLADKDGPFEQCTQALEDIKSYMMRTLLIKNDALPWKFMIKESARIMGKIAHLKTLVEISLEKNHLKLVRAIRDEPAYEYPAETSIGKDLVNHLSVVPLLERHNGILERPLTQIRVPAYECAFWFLNCSYISHDEEDWKTHCLSHFRGEEPPRSVQCPLCKFQGTYKDGWTAWSARMEHIAYCHLVLGRTLKSSRPDFHLFQHLWQKRLIDDRDLKELKGGNHTLTRDPNNFVTTHGRRERDRRRQRAQRIGPGVTAGSSGVSNAKIKQSDEGWNSDTNKSESAGSTCAPESIFSIDMHSSSSGSSYTSTLHLSAVDAFAALLIADDVIHSLCISGITDHHVGPARLERNLRRLLYRYWKDIGQEVITPAQHIAVELFQSRTRLQRIANRVRRMVSDEHDKLAIVNEPPDTNAHIQRYLDSLSQLHERGPDENSLDLKKKETSDKSGSSDDEQGAEINEPLDFNLQSLTAFLSNSRAFELLKQNLQNFISPTFSSELESISQRILKQTGVSDKDTALLQSVISQLRSVNPASICISDQQVSIIDKWKHATERRSGTSWDWWPLRQPIYPCFPGQVYLQWQCKCGSQRRTQVPAWVGDSLTRLSNMFRGSSRSTLPTHTQSTSQSHVNPTNNRNSNLRGSNRVPSSGSRNPASNTLSKITGHVFLGVKRGNEHKVAEINVCGLGDDQFFRELRVEYYKMKGYLRRYFSIWRYQHCDFVKFEKFEHDRSFPRGEGLPENDPEYVYIPKPRKPSDPMPPIHPHEFETRFYSCYGGGQCHNHIIGSCNKKVCRSDDDGLERIPKRIRPLTVGIAKRGYFWGLYARENISFFMVALYNILLLVLPFTFWICWLFVWNHAGDLQNASIPATVVAALLPMFWLPVFTNKDYNR